MSRMEKQTEQTYKFLQKDDQQDVNRCCLSFVFYSLMKCINIALVCKKAQIQ